MHILRAPQLLTRLAQIRKDTPGFLLALSHDYGDVVGFELGSTRAFFINHPQAVQRVLQENQRNYTKETIQYQTLALITGQGLLTADGELWLQHRRLMQPVFAQQRLRMLDRVVVPATDKMLMRWKSAAQSGEVIDVDHAMLELALEIVGLSLFGLDLSQEAPQLVHAALEALDYVIYRAQNPFAPPPSWPTPRNRAFHRALARLNAAVESIIAARLEKGLDGDDLLTLLLKAHREGELSRAQVRDELITMIIAGHETVATALTWTWYLLAHHPQVWERLAGEVDWVLAGQPPNGDHLPRLEFTAQVFSEALRLYPPAWLITRKAQAEDIILEEPIPAGALVIICPYALHRHPRIWPQPEHFDPERFAEPHARDIPRFAYIPFGGGPRLCIGNRFALIEAQLVLARVTQVYRLEYAGVAPKQAQPLVTLRPKGGMPMRILPREG